MFNKRASRAKMSWRTSMVLAALLIAGCQSSSEFDTEVAPVRTFPPRVTVPTTLVADFSDVLIRSFPFNNAKLQVRDCYNKGFYAERIECESLHDGQIIGTAALVSSFINIADINVWLAAIDTECVDEFERFRMDDVYSRDFRDTGSSEFVIDAIIRTVNPLTIYCTVISRNGEQWTGTAEVAVGAYDGVEVGNCFNPPTAIQDAQVVPCSEPHFAEMFLKNAKIGLADEKDPYPTDAVWGDFLDRFCLAPFEEYTGKRYEEVDYSMALIYPVESDWRDIASRRVSCAITSGTGQQWVGSKGK